MFPKHGINYLPCCARDAANTFWANTNYKRRNSGQLRDRLRVKANLTGTANLFQQVQNSAAHGMAGLFFNYFLQQEQLAINTL